MNASRKLPPPSPVFVRFPPEVRAELDRRAAQTGATVPEIVRRLVADALKRKTRIQ